MSGATVPIRSQDRRSNASSIWPLSEFRAHDNLIARIMPAVILVYASLLPFEIRITLAEQTLYPPRIAAFILLPWLLYQLPRMLNRYVVWDIVFILSATWMVIAFMANYGPYVGFARGGILAFDVAVPYLTARLAIRESNDFRRLLVMIAPGLLAAGLSMLAEVALGRSLVRPFFANLFGPLPLYQGGDAVGLANSASFERRLGILRASGPFSHPILAGMFLASFLPLYLYSGLRRWPFPVGLGASVLSVLSASSAPFLLLLTNFGILLTDQVQRLVSFISWKLILPLIAAFALLLHLASQNGLINVLIRFTLNPQTGYFRQLIWEYGTRSVAEHPAFGIGYEGFNRPSWMPESVDNHWLLLAMRFGLLPAVGIGLVIVTVILVLCVRNHRDDETERRLRVGLATSLFSFSLLGFSVAFFGGIQTWFYMLIAVAISIAASASKPALIEQPQAQLPSKEKLIYKKSEAT